jgi:hypothetical protein
MNTITFFAPSGAPASGTIIEQLEPPGNTSGANYIGFFGTGGPEGVPFAVFVSSYQDKTFVTNTSGTNLGQEPWGLLASGELINHKFLTSSTVNVGNQDEVDLIDVPKQSGMLLVRFEATGPGEVVTQNGVWRTVALNASSGVSDVTAIVTGIDVRCYEAEEDSGWTNTAGSAAVDNRLFIANHTDNDLIHDFFVSASASPEDTGERNDWGFAFILEFL